MRENLMQDTIQINSELIYNFRNLLEEHSIIHSNDIPVLETLVATLYQLHPTQVFVHTSGHMIFHVFLVLHSVSLVLQSRSEYLVPIYVVVVVKDCHLQLEQFSYS